MKKKFFILSVLLSGFVGLFAKDNKTTDEYLGTPFGGVAWPVPGVIGAADFDIGGEGVAYHDTDATNSAGAGNLGYFYRDDPETGINDAPGVDVQWRTDANCYNIGWTSSGEWLNYTINVQEEGLYDIACSAETASATFNYSLSLDFELINTYSFPANGSNNIADNHTAKAVFLPAGQHVLTFTFAGGANLVKLTLTKAYTGTAFKENKIPVTIQAEDFDEGGNGVAYNNPGTATNTYRPGENIAIGGSGDNIHVATVAGEWLKYTINVPALNYKDFLFTFYWANTKADKFTVLLNGNAIATDVEIPNTGSLDTYQAVELPEIIRLYRGENVITILANSGNFDKFSITKPPYQGTPFFGDPFEIPGIVEAEYFDAGGEGIAYHDSDASNSGPEKDLRADSPGVDLQPNSFNGEPIINIGWTTAAEWLNYTINVTEDASYDFIMVASTANVDQTVYFDLDGERITSVLIHTAAHATFQKHTAAKIPLTAGIHVLTLSSTGNTNYDKIIIEKSYFGTPFNGPHTIPGTIEAENFDIAEGFAQDGNGETYYNPGTITAPNTYRPEVNIEIGGTEGNRYIAAAEGEWLKYTFEAPAGNTYYIVSFLWANTKASTYEVYLDGVLLEDEIEVPNTGSFSNYEESELTNSVLISGGKHILTVHVKSGHLDKINMNESFYLGEPFFGEAWKVPAEGEVIIEAEYFDKGGREVAFHDNQTNGGSNGTKVDSNGNIDPEGIFLSHYIRGTEDGSSNVEMEKRGEEGEIINIGWSNVGEWVAYSINVEKTGIYDVWQFMSSDNSNRANHIKVDNKTYPDITVRTSAWTNFLWFATTNVELTAGPHILYVYYNGNFDKIKITKHEGSTPYGGTSLTIPGVLEAWKFDEGPQGLAYSTSDPTLGGYNNSIRQESEVNILGTDPDYYVYFGTGGSPGWVNYTVDVKEAGTYKATFRVRCDTGNESFTLSGATSGSVILPNDPGSIRERATLVDFAKAGVQNISISASGTIIGIVSVTFEKYEGYGGTPFHGTPFIVAADGSAVNIEAEDFDKGGNKISYYDTGGNDGPLTNTYRRENGDDEALVQMETHDANIGAGINIGWSAAGEWLAYTIEVEAAGEYDITMTLATNNDDRKQHVKIDNVEYPEVTFHTSGWAEYITLPLVEQVSLTAGKHVVYVYYSGNFDKITIGKNLTAIKTPNVFSGTVYVDREGNLNLKGFSSPTASFAVYNLLGQKITGSKITGDIVQTPLPAKGIYIVRVQDKGKIASYKVIFN